MTMRIFKKRDNTTTDSQPRHQHKNFAIHNREEMRALRYSIKGCENKRDAYFKDSHANTHEPSKVPGLSAGSRTVKTRARPCLQGGIIMFLLVLNRRLPGHGAQRRHTADRQQEAGDFLKTRPQT
jgi:hypothetical protein